MRELKERTPEFSAAYQLCVARHSRADGVRPTTAPCALCAAYIVAGVDAAPAQTGEPVAWRNRAEVQDALNAIVESAGHPQFEYALPEALHNLCDLVTALRAPALVPEVREEDVAEMRMALESCEAHGEAADVAQYRRILAVLESIQSRTTGGER